MKKIISNNNNNNKIKTSKGRQKIEIKELQNKNARQVTFSKRRTGLFKKASELCVLCGAEIAIIAFSPNDKPFTFGHPNVDSIVDRYLADNNHTDDDYNQSEGQEISETMTLDPSLQELNREYEEAMEELKEEKKRAKKIEEVKKESGEGFWWDESVDGLELDELEEYVKALEELRKKVISRGKELVMMEDMAVAGIGSSTDVVVDHQQMSTGCGSSSVIDDGRSNNGGFHGFSFGFGDIMKF